MRFRTGLFTLAIAAVTVVIDASPAPAGPIWEITSDAKGGVDQLLPVTFSFAGSAETGLAGTLTTKLPSGQSVDTYCIDLYDTVYVGNGGSTWSAEVLSMSQYTGNSAFAITGGNGGAIAYLYSQFASTVATSVQSAALQIAIWKVDYDDSGDLATGNFQFADSSDPNSIQHQVFVQTSAYLAGFDPTLSTGEATLFRATSHPDDLYQDLVAPENVYASLVLNAAVPEPSSMAMMLSGLVVAGLVVARRRRTSTVR
jgi:PEP-CTERM motif